MHGSVLRAIDAILDTDANLTTAQRDVYKQSLRLDFDKLEALVGGGDTAKAPSQDSSGILRREQVADLFGRSKRFVDGLASAGLLPRVVLPGRRRAVGFRQSDVLSLISQDPAGPCSASDETANPGEAVAARPQSRNNGGTR